MYAPFSAVARDENEAREFIAASEPLGLELSRAVELKTLPRLLLLFQMLVPHAGFESLGSVE